MLFAALLLGFCCRPALSVEAEAEGQSIAVVRTWDDLAKRPSVELHKNATARFGIQTLRAPLFDSVMIYCMTEAYDPDDQADDDDSVKLGPYRLTVRREGEEAEKIEKLENNVPLTPGKRDYGKLVFAQIIPMTKVGATIVELRNDKDDVVASAKIDCMDAPFHAWGSLRVLDDDAAQAVELAGVYDAFIETIPGGASGPKLNGRVPVLYQLSSGTRGPTAFRDDAALSIVPDLAPQEPEPLTANQKAVALKQIADLSSETFKTRARAFDALQALSLPAKELLQNAARQTSDAEALLRLRQIVAQLDEPFRIRMSGLNVMLKTPVFFPSINIESYFLARWWVNGKPVKPMPNEDPDARPLNGQGGLPANKEARLKLKLNLAALGAKSGDTIALQLLFSPDGEPPPPTAVEKLEPEEGERLEEVFPAHAPLISNRVEFKAP